MSDSKKQSRIVIGIGLILIAVVLIVYAASQPKILINPTSSSAVSAEASSKQLITSESKNATADFTNSTKKADEKTADSITYPINLNTCTLEELMTVNGIGEARASAILEYRDHIGRYTSVEQIKDISGIGESTYEMLAPYLTV